LKVQSGKASAGILFMKKAKAPLQNQPGSVPAWLVVVSSNSNARAAGKTMPLRENKKIMAKGISQHRRGELAI